MSLTFACLWASTVTRKSGIYQFPPEFLLVAAVAFFIWTRDMDRPRKVTLILLTLTVGCGLIGVIGYVGGLTGPGLPACREP